MRRALALAALVALTECTTEQVAAWVEWWHQDPTAAEEYANRPEVQDLLAGDWDHDGVLEPEPMLSDEPDPSSSSDSGSSSSPSSDGDYDGDQGGQDTAGVYWPWTALAQCESGGNWATDTGNGYYGGLQFAWASWAAVGGSGNPAHASPSEQVARAELLQDRQGWGAWPTCARIVGLL